MEGTQEMDPQPDSELVRYSTAKAEGVRTVLFVCSGNAFRSQVAEGLVNHYFKGQWAAFSAGLLPAGIPRDLVKVMAEQGIDIKSHRSKHLDLFTGCCFDKVFILCADVSRICPELPGYGETEVLCFPDPLSAAGYAEGCCIGIKATFRSLRDSMKTTLLSVMKRLT